MLKPIFVDNTKVAMPFPPPTEKAPTKANTFGLTQELTKIQAEATPRTT